MVKARSDDDDDDIVILLLSLILSFRWTIAAIERGVSSWSSEQCVGDVLVKFLSSLKPFVNYIQSYAALLLNVERCTQNSVAFRASGVARILCQGGGTGLAS